MHGEKQLRHAVVFGPGVLRLNALQHLLPGDAEDCCLMAALADVPLALFELRLFRQQAKVMILAFKVVVILRDELRPLVPVDDTLIRRPDAVQLAAVVMAVRYAATTFGVLERPLPGLDDASK